MEPVVHLVPEEARGSRLDQFLTDLHADLSRSRLRALIEEEWILVDDAASKPARKLRGGERVSVRLPPPPPTEPQPEELPLSILYEDPDLLVVDKESGLVVHPAAGVHEGTLVNALLFHVEGLAEVERAGIVHRLDKDTSGCLVVAKTQAAFAGLQAAFKAREVEKRYLALVHGVPQDEVTYDTPFGRHPRDRVRFTGRLAEGSERRAITHAQVRERYPGASLVEVDLETGRTHQIRVHLSEAGHPLLADAVYGGTKREGRLGGDAPIRLAARAIGRQALHAHRLSFAHPISGEPIAVEAPIPADLQRALDILRG